MSSLNLRLWVLVLLGILVEAAAPSTASAGPVVTCSFTGTVTQGTGTTISGAFAINAGTAASPPGGTYYVLNSDPSTNFHYTVAGFGSGVTGTPGTGRVFNIVFKSNGTGVGKFYLTAAVTGSRSIVLDLESCSSSNFTQLPQTCAPIATQQGTFTIYSSTNTVLVQGNIVMSTCVSQ